ncbi:STAS domain-containing protein [Pseudonocardia halophobica]|uniref:STAS domain-containing protein n=1 Tax=Pseudonocardia halophobica TaxID=29401 RepID=UPI003D8BEEA2
MMTGPWRGPQVRVTVGRHRHGGREAVIVRVAGEIDDETGGQVRAAYAEAFAAGLPTVVVDLTGGTLLGSSGIADLLLVRRSATTTGTELRLVAGENPRVLRPLRLTGVADDLGLCRDLDEALAGEPGSRAG